MLKEKTQTARILDGFVTVIIIASAVILVLSGVAISKVNTDYMETGIRAEKIVAERSSMQISLTTHDGIFISSENDLPIDTILTFLPPPVNTVYLITNEIIDMVNGD